MTAPHPLLTLTDEVADALRVGGPVVALESTIISHGMPYPQNVAMATEVEEIIRAAGAVPATIAVLDGRPRIGLTADDLELLASDEHVAKVSVRDLPFVVARRTHGATTVAATMRLAALAGIRVFVTGGLGGVHRGAQQSFDESADLTELGSTDVAVISAGVKSILDIGLTLERLETLGVPGGGGPAGGRGAAGRAPPPPPPPPPRGGPPPRPTRSPPTRSAGSSSRRSPTWRPGASTARRRRRTSSAGSSRSPAAPR